MRVTRMIWYAGTMLTALAMLAASATAAAQQQAHMQQQARTLHPRTGRAAADSSGAERRKAASVKGFQGIAARLNTTPEALQNWYDHARETNPKLSRGNFIAANVLADNLGPQHPNITTPAILSGLESGQSIGQTLQSLGLSASDAKQAKRAADRQVKDAEKRGKDADKRAQAESKKAEEKSRRDANEKKPDNHR